MARLPKKPTATATAATPPERLRICTLLPSATEIAYLLGLGDAVLGVTHECDFPADAKRKRQVVRSRIDGTATSAEIDRQVRALVGAGEAVYALDEEAVRDISPNLVVTQALCEVCALPYDDVVSTMSAMGIEPEVVALNPTSLADVFDDIVRVGKAAGVEAAAREKVADLRQRVDRVVRRAAGLPRPRVACLEWLDPLMIGGHWVPEMIELAGGLDTLGVAGQPTRRVALDEVVAGRPDVILLMPCGYDAGRAEAEAGELAILAQLRDTPAARNGSVFAVNANAYFSRSGPRLVEGVEMLASLLRPAADGAAPNPHDATVLA